MASSRPPAPVSDEVPAHGSAHATPHPTPHPTPPASPGQSVRERPVLVALDTSQVPVTGLTGLLPAGWQCLELTSDHPEQLQPDVVVVDGSDPHRIARVSARWPRAGVLALLGPGDGAPTVLAALAGGAAGCARDPSPGMLVAHLLAVHHRSHRRAPHR